MFSKENAIKEKIIQALKNDGFKIINQKDIVIASKKENTLYIKDLENIQTEINLFHILQGKTINKIGGIAVEELKKLLSESINKKVDFVEYILNKLNWESRFVSSVLINNKDILYHEIITDRNEIITLVFPNSDKKNNFLALEMNCRKFLQVIDSFQYKELKSFAPNLYELVLQET